MKGGATLKEFFKKKSVLITAIVLASIIFILAVLEIGILIRSTWKPYRPEHAKENIGELILKDSLSDDDYRRLYRQTGLTKLGVDGLIEAGRAYKILAIQDDFFGDREYEFSLFAPFTGYFRQTDGPTGYAQLEDGDILYSPSTFFSFLRLGHSSVVVDGETRRIAQASGYGSSLEFLPASNFFIRPAYAVLRPDASADIRGAVADKVYYELADATYDFFGGYLTPKFPEKLTRTQCAHMIWYAYYSYGVNLDDGGRAVTPDNLLTAERTLVVQVYGMDLDLVDPISCKYIKK